MNSKGNNKISNGEWTVGSVLHGYKVTPTHPLIICQAQYSWCEECSLCKKDGTRNSLHWEKILPSGMTESEFLKRQYNERIQRSMIRHYRNLSWTGFFISLLGIPVACVPIFGHIPQLFAGIMIIGGAWMFLYYECMRINSDNK